MKGWNGKMNHKILVGGKITGVFDDVANHFTKKATDVMRNSGCYGIDKNTVDNILPENCRITFTTKDTKESFTFRKEKIQQNCKSKDYGYGEQYFVSIKQLQEWTK
jgi:hypothetical protein